MIKRTAHCTDSIFSTSFFRVRNLGEYDGPDFLLPDEEFLLYTNFSDDEHDTVRDQDESDNVENSFERNAAESFQGTVSLPALRTLCFALREEYTEN